MLTPTRREVATTDAVKVPAGAQLWGGRYDGAVVRASYQPPGRACVVFLMEGGAQLERGRKERVEWLHPASRRRAW